MQGIQTKNQLWATKASLRLHRKKDFLNLEKFNIEHFVLNFRELDRWIYKQR